MHFTSATRYSNIVYTKFNVVDQTEIDFMYTTPVLRRQLNYYSSDKGKHLQLSVITRAIYALRKCVVRITQFN